jgi:pyruvate dehydrogenase E1 component beta subunit
MTAMTNDHETETLVSVRAAINQALDEALASDPSVFLLGEDIIDPAGGVFQVTQGLSTKYGSDRVRDTPISEQAIVGAAIGAAVGGMRPVAELMFMDFLAIALDQLVNHAAKLRYMSGGRVNVPMTIRTAVGAGFGVGAQHSQMLEAWLMHAPGVKVVIPSNPADAKSLLRACIEDDDPCVFVEQLALLERKGPLGGAIRLGQADITRSGSDVSVLTYGRQVHDALDAAERLAAEGISVEVVDLRSLVPLDEATIFESVSRTRRAVVVHEAVMTCGAGAEISSRIHEELFSDLDAPVQRVGAEAIPVPYARPLEQEMLPGGDDIVAAVRRSFEYRRAVR